MRVLRRLAAFSLLLAAACYTVPDSDMAARYDSIYVPTLENRTMEPGLHTLVSEMLRREFQHDGQLRLVNAEADADLVLSGTLTDYRVRASSFDENDNPIQFSVYIAGHVSVREGRTDTVVWQKQITGSDFYQTRRARSTIRARGRTQGLEEAAEAFAELVVFDFVDSAW